MARIYKHTVVYDSRQTGMQPGVLAFREAEISRPAREQQLKLLTAAWDKSCDMINEKGVGHYRELIVRRCRVKPQVVDSLPQGLRYEHVGRPSAKDAERVDKWLEENK